MSPSNVAALPVSEWSGWGGGVLESDRAMDAVSGDLSAELGVNIHFAGNPEHYAPDHPEGKDKECSHDPKARTVDETREYLDRGNFTRVFNKYKKKRGLLNGRVTAEEMCIFLTVKAMQLGAKVSPSQREWLQSVYKKAGLCREGIEQMERALAEYTSGEPYELIEPDRTEHNIYLAFEVARADALNQQARTDYPADRYFTENIPTPDPFLTTRQAERRAKGEPAWFPGGPVLRECAECKVKSHHATNGLKECAGCHKFLLCSKECQRKNWKIHKKHCATMAAAPAPKDVNTLKKSPMLRMPGFDPLGDRFFTETASNGKYETQLPCPLM